MEIQILEKMLTELQDIEAIKQLKAEYCDICDDAHNPRIAVKGDTAHGSWNLLGPFTFREGRRQLWVAVRYEEDYVKVNGKWKIKYLHGVGRMAAPYEEGWESTKDAGVFSKS